jgi:hypothetical protein
MRCQTPHRWVFGVVSLRFFSRQRLDGSSEQWRRSCVVVSAHSPGEHRISFIQNHLKHGVEDLGTSLHHTIFLTAKTEGQITTSVESKATTFVPTIGTIAIIPARACCS